MSQNLSPCSDGNLSIVGLKQACVPPGMPAFVGQRYDALDDFQVDTIMASDDLLTWQHGTASVLPTTPCELSPGTPCPMRLFLTDGATPGGHLAGRSWLRYTDVVYQPSFLGTPTEQKLLDATRGQLMAFSSHEYGHALQHAYERDAGVFGFLGDPMTLETLPDLMGWDHCLFMQPDLEFLPDELCVSPSRIGQDPLRLGPSNMFISNPTQGALFPPKGGTQSLFFRYAAEQYAVPLPSIENPANRSHPESATTTDSAIQSDYIVEIGDISRRTDEGLDLIRHIWGHLEPAAHPSYFTARRRIDAALVEHLGRGFANVLFDLHTAIVLKDYRDGDLLNDARWHLELVGNLNRGADDDYFPANPRPAAGQSHVALKNDAATGRYDFANLGLFGDMPDLLRRAPRVLDSWTSFTTPFGTTTTKVNFTRGSVESGFTEIAPFGVAYLSVHPETLASTSYPLRIRARVLSGGARMRIYRIGKQIAPELVGTCKQFPEGPAPAPEEQCVAHDNAYLGFEFTEFEETLNWSKALFNPYDEVIVVLSAGAAGAGVGWKLDSSGESGGTIGSPKKSYPKKSHPPGAQGPGSPSTAKVTVSFALADGDGRALSYDPAEIRFVLPGCAAPPCTSSAGPIREIPPTTPPAPSSLRSYRGMDGSCLPSTCPTGRASCSSARRGQAGRSRSAIQASRPREGKSSTPPKTVPRRAIACGPSSMRG